MTNQELKSAIKEWEVIINTDGDKISQFIFPDGIQYIENDVNYLSTDFSLVDTFSKPPKIQDHIIFIKSDGSIPHYFFCLRFRSSPFSRPSAFSLLKTVLTSKKTNEGANKQEFNGFNQDEIEYYMSKMEDEFEKEMIHFKTLKRCPTCLFAFVFETQHPCHELYFNLIELITRLEASKRTVAANLHRILSSYSLPHRESGVIIVGNDEDKNISDDFILIEKIENNSPQHHVDCVISVKDSRESIQSESSSSQDTNENEDKINSDREDITSDNESQIKANKTDKNDSGDKINSDREDIASDNESQIKVNKTDKNDSGDQINLDREDITSYSEDKVKVDREDITSDNESKINVNKIDKNDSGDQCKADRIDKNVGFDCLWPANAFKARDDFLSSLYKSSKFPSVGEQITFKVGSSALSKFVWTRPTTMQSCVGLCVYGIEPLLECNIVVAGLDFEPIVRVVSSLSHLIFPLAWMYPILTIAPDSFVDILGSPVPFIAGVFKSEACVRKIIELDVSENILIINMDDRTIKWPKQTYQKLACHTKYLNALKKFCLTTKNTQKKSTHNHDDVLIIQSNGEKKCLEFDEDEMEQ